MAYNPGITYSGASYLADALGSVGENVAKALDRTEEIRKQNALNDPIMQHALDTGRITQEEYNKYHEGNFMQKSSIANGVMANVHDDWQRQQFAQQQQDKAMERALQLQIAHMAHDPSPMAGQPIFGPAPQADPAYAERGLDETTPTGQPVPTQGPQVGIYGEKGDPRFFPWREVTGVNTDGTLSGTGQVNVDNTTLPGSTIVTKEGTKQMKIIPNSGGAVPGSVAEGEGVPENTYSIGPKGELKLLPKDVRRKLEAAAMPTPDPTPIPIKTRVGNAIWNTAFGTPTPTPTVPPLAPTVTAPAPGPVAAPAQTPVPTVVAPQVPAGQRVIILNPDGVPHTIPAERLPDYLNAGWTQPPEG